MSEYLYVGFWQSKCRRVGSGPGDTANDQCKAGLVLALPGGPGAKLTGGGAGVRAYRVSVGSRLSPRLTRLGR